MKVNIVQNSSYVRQRYKSINEANQVEILYINKATYGGDMIVCNNVKEAEEKWITNIISHHSSIIMYRGRLNERKATSEKWIVIQAYGSLEKRQ